MPSSVFCEFISLSLLAGRIGVLTARQPVLLYLSKLSAVNFSWNSRMFPSAFLWISIPRSLPRSASCGYVGTESLVRLPYFWAVLAAWTRHRRKDSFQPDHPKLSKDIVSVQVSHAQQMLETVDGFEKEKYLSTHVSIAKNLLRNLFMKVSIQESNGHSPLDCLYFFFCCKQKPNFKPNNWRYSVGIVQPLFLWNPRATTFSTVKTSFLFNTYLLVTVFLQTVNAGATRAADVLHQPDSAALSKAGEPKL